MRAHAPHGWQEAFPPNLSLGHTCGSPALRKQLLCYFHVRVLKGVDNRIDAINDPETIFEDTASVQCALIKVFNMPLRGTIDLNPPRSCFAH
jgi:hypothetical protein